MSSHTYQSSPNTTHQDPMTQADSLHAEMEKYQRYIDPKNKSYLMGKIKEKLATQFRGEDLEAKVQQQYELITANAREKVAELSRQMTEIEETHPELTVDLGLADRDEELAVHNREPKESPSPVRDPQSQKRPPVAKQSAPPRENPVPSFAESPAAEALSEDTFQRIKHTLNYELIDSHLGTLDPSILPQDPTSIQKRLDDARNDLGEVCQMIIRDWQAFDPLIQFRLNTVFGELQTFFSQSQLPRDTYDVDTLNSSNTEGREKISIVEERGVEIQDMLVYLLTKSIQSEDPVEKERVRTLAQHLYLTSTPYTSSQYDLSYLEPVEWERGRVLYDTRLIKGFPELSTGNHKLNEELAYYIFSHRRVLSLHLVPRVIVSARPEPTPQSEEVSVPAVSVSSPKTDIPTKSQEAAPSAGSPLESPTEDLAEEAEIPTEAKVFLAQLLRDSGETINTAPSAARLKSLYTQLSDEIAKALASKIPPDQLDNYNALIARATDPVEIQTFIRSHVPDAARLIIAVMDRFRRDYLNDKNADLV